jgi:hypothetical protein
VVLDAPGELWANLDRSLRKGQRGLPGGTTLSRLLDEKRGGVDRKVKSPLTIGDILDWADAHLASTGKWPSARSGAVLAVPGETWGNLNSRLEKGQRGLPGGLSLSGLLAEYRGGGDHPDRQPLHLAEILDWADAYHAATGLWPTIQSGAVSAATFPVTWVQVDYALRYGARGLPGDSSLSRLWAEHRGYKKYRRTTDLTVEQILAWADAYHAAHGRWPGIRAGAVEAAPGVTWKGIAHALREGYRGMPGGTTLGTFLAEHRGHRNRAELSQLTIEKILAWADAHHAVHGDWPSCNGGPIDAAPDETWKGIAMALRLGHRGLRGGTSLARLLDDHRPRRPRLLTVAMIEAWALSHHRATGYWPNICSGRVRDLPDETWKRIDRALRDGNRGLPGGGTLPMLIGALRNKFPLNTGA